MSLGSIRQEKEMRPQHFHPKPEGACKASGYSWRQGKKTPKQVAGSDGILAFNIAHGGKRNKWMCAVYGSPWDVTAIISGHAMPCLW